MLLLERRNQATEEAVSAVSESRLSQKLVKQCRLPILHSGLPPVEDKENRDTTQLTKLDLPFMIGILKLSGGGLVKVWKMAQLLGVNEIGKVMPRMTKKAFSFLANKDRRPLPKIEK